MSDHIADIQMYCTALHHAINEGCISIAQRLLLAGANINAQTIVS